MDRRTPNLDKLTSSQLAAARAAVSAERERKGWSLADAVAAGGDHIRAQTWLNFERGETSTLTRKTYVVIRDAFDWPEDWPTNPPTTPPRDLPRGAIDKKLAEILRRLDEVPTRATLERRLIELTEAVDALTAEIGKPGRRRGSA